MEGVHERCIGALLQQPFCLVLVALLEGHKKSLVTLLKGTYKTLEKVVNVCTNSWKRDFPSKVIFTWCVQLFFK
jgi:hypothetical protein